MKFRSFFAFHLQTIQHEYSQSKCKKSAHQSHDPNTPLCWEYGNTAQRLNK